MNDPGLLSQQPEEGTQALWSCSQTVGYPGGHSITGKEQRGTGLGSPKGHDNIDSETGPEQDWGPLGGGGIVHV